jgi:hypothetical protein
MGNHELDNSTEEGLQADILPCMADSMLRDISELTWGRNKPRKRTTALIRRLPTFSRSFSR